MKKIVIYLYLLSGLFNNICFAKDVKNVEACFVETPVKEYKQKTVKKHYKVYDLSITNKNTNPLLLTTNSEILFIQNDGTVIKSDDRRKIYRKSRKKDIGRYYSFALPGAIIAGGITGITFFIGAPIAAAVYVGMYLPTDKAVRTNVKISQDMFNTIILPIRMEKDKNYKTRVFIPKNIEFRKVVISNVSFDLKEMYDLTIEGQKL